MTQQTQIAWRPQPKQKILIDCPYREIFFGGSRGGGKSNGILGKYGIKSMRYKHTNAIFFRKELPQADDLIEEAKEIYLRLKGVEYKMQSKTFEFPTGSRVRFRPLANEQDAEKYQGQNLCVGVETKVKMADGTLKPIKHIKIGDKVQTLIGAKEVTRVTKPYKAPCVKSEVWDQDGILLGNQIHPVWHPVLSAYGVFSNAECFEQRKFQKHHIDELSRRWALSECSADVKSHPHKDRAYSAWFSFLKDDRTYYKGFEGDSQEIQQLEGLFYPVALHAQTVQLRKKHLRSYLDVSKRYHAQHKCDEQSWVTYAAKQKRYLNPLQPFVLYQQFLGLLFSFCDGVSYARTMMQKVLNYLTYCPFYRRLCGEHFHQDEENDLMKPQSPNDVAGLCHRLNEDALDTIQKHNLVDSELWEHPYTFEALNLLEDVEFGKMVMTYVGSHLVTDLTVKDANHYITEIGLINKNTDCAVEEAGNYEDPKPIDKLFGALRSKHGVPTQLILTANPGGVGQLWIKERYIDPAPLGMRTLYRKLPNGQVHKYIYIPSRVQDNKILLQNDPNYINNLYLVGSPELVQAWLEGSWDAIEGQYFPEFNAQKHVIKPFKIPDRWHKYIGYDWGHFSPYACVWLAVCDGKDDNGKEIPFPKGSIIVYRELSESNISNEDQARKILELSRGEDILVKAADTQIFDSMGGPSIASQMQDVGLHFQKADKSRIPGWSQIRRRLKPNLEENTPPMIYFFDTCRHLIKTIASVPICKKNAEDLDTTFDDHLLDALRYACMENIILQTDYRKPEEHATKGVINVANLVKEHKRRNRKSRI